MSLDLRSSQKVPTAQEFQQHTIERRKRTIPEYRLIAAPSAIKFGEFTFSMYEDSVPSHDAQKPDIQWNCDTVVDGKFLHFYVKGHDREEMQIAIDCVKQLRAAD